MDRCRREFLRKWGEWIQNDSYQYPIINPKYDKGLIIKNCTDQLLAMLEPWFDTIYVDEGNTKTLIKNYIEKEQPNTIVDLNQKSYHMIMKNKIIF